MNSADKIRFAVPIERLRRTIDPRTIAAAPRKEGVIGQESAMAALDVGLKMTGGEYETSHYNIMVVGPENTGRTTKTLQHVNAHAASIKAAPSDIICLFNFAAPNRPDIISVPGGNGVKIKKRLDAIGASTLTVLPQNLKMFREQFLAKVGEQVEEVWENAIERVKAFGFIIIPNEDGTRSLVALSFADPSQPMAKTEFEALDEDIKKKILTELGPKAREIFDEMAHIVQLIKHTAHAELQKMSEQVVDSTLVKQLDIIRKLASDNGRLEKYLSGMVKHVKEHCLGEGTKKPEPNPLAFMGIQAASGNNEAEGIAAYALPFRINVLVSRGGSEQPPVVHVKVPSYSALFGRIHYQVTRDNGVLADHTRVEAGAFLKANGGYLVFDLRDLLRWGGGLAFYKLLKVIKTRRLAIETKASFVDADFPIDFRPQEVPVDVRVIVICDRSLEYMVHRYEPEFANLFRITAEFDDRMKVADAPSAYTTFLDICRNINSLPEFTPEAIARIIEYGIRRADDQVKASAEFGIIKDIITEAAHWAKQAKQPKVEVVHVQKAIDERFNRQALRIRHYLEHYDSGHMLVDHDGAKVGQINGLAVMQASEEAVFGLPLRITARAYAGKDKVVLVQREVGTSGPSSDTAVTIIRGYISGQYGRKKPPCVSVQLCFEQCYGGIDGDSATLAETVALISAITGLPIDQRLAITGSMNQWGEAQPIGGVNYKVEGHFDCLQRRGLLKGGHGVVMPKQNLDNLMLKPEVVEAQRQGLYQVYAVSSINDALEILLGHPAEEIHKLVEAKLNEMNGGVSITGTTRKLFCKLFRRGEPKLED